MRIIPAALLFILLPYLAEAQTAGQVGERAQGMGGAFVGVADDATAVYWNPAGIANLFKFDTQINSSGGQSTFAGAAMPALGIAYFRTRAAVSSPADRKNEGSGEVRVSTVTTQNFAVSLVQSIVNTVVIGTTLRAVKGPDATAFDIDAGSMASVGVVRVGLVARHLRESIGTTRQVRAGLGIVPRSLPLGVYGPFSLAFDIDLTRTPTPHGDSRQAAIGSEQWWAKGALGTRLGVHWNTLNSAQAAFSAGFTVKLPWSAFAEGHLTKGPETGDSGGGFGLRVTF